MKSQQWVWSSVVLIGMVGVLSAQTAKPTFEVASVKKNVSGAPGPGGGPTQRITREAGGVWRATNITLESLILYANPTPGFVTLREDQLLGGPEWVRQDRFDIQAKAGRDVPVQESVQMVRALLEERFKLVVRRDHEERDVYALTLARKDGRLGPDMHQASPECKKRRGLDAVAAIYEMPRTTSSGARVSFSVQCETMEQVAAGPLQRILGTTVIDKTGLTGLWDFAVAHSNQVTATADSENRPTLDIALKEQLGLKIERGKGPVDVLVIDSVGALIEN